MKFFTPRKIFFGWNSVENLKALKGKIAIVSGPSVWSEVGDFVPFDGEIYPVERKSPTEEPVEEDVEQVVSFLTNSKPEIIVAIGGGSVIDTAKLAWVFYENSGIKWRDVYARKIPQLRKKAIFVAIETTSGSGSGISAAAVVTDKNGVKHGIVNENLIPDISVYDPNFVMSMPKKTAIYSGMDALTHAIESYVSKIDNVAADTLSLKAVELIFKNLQNSVMGDENSRAQVHYGNMLAAMGFANSRLGLCHAASHKIGGRYKIEHGKINAILLPYFIIVTKKYTRKYEDIERMLRIESLEDEIFELNESFGVPRTFPPIMDMIDTIARETHEDPLMETNPAPMSFDEIKDFLLVVATGEIHKI